MTLTVKAEKYVAMVYMAYYANGESGADKPWGDGHGGNGGGMTDEKTETYSDQWVVKPTAPPGPGYVKVEIVYPRKTGSERETLKIPFRVGSISDPC